MQAGAVRRVAQALNGGKARGRTARVAKLMGTSIATVRSWGADGGSEGRKRQMSPTARRLLFLLLALHEQGHDLDEWRRVARRLEQSYLQRDDD